MGQVAGRGREPLDIGLRREAGLDGEGDPDGQVRRGIDPQGVAPGRVRPGSDDLDGVGPADLPVPRDLELAAGQHRADGPGPAGGLEAREWARPGTGQLLAGGCGADLAVIPDPGRVDDLDFPRLRGGRREHLVRDRPAGGGIGGEPVPRPVRPAVHLRDPPAGPGRRRHAITPGDREQGLPRRGHCHLRALDIARAARGQCGADPADDIGRRAGMRQHTWARGSGAGPACHRGDRHGHSGDGGGCPGRGGRADRDAALLAAPVRLPGQAGRDTYLRGEPLHARAELILEFGRHEVPSSVSPAWRGFGLGVSPRSAELTHPGEAARSRRLDRSDGAPEYLGGFGLTQLLPVPEHDDRALPGRKLEQDPHESVPQVDCGRRVVREPAVLGPQQVRLAPPGALAAPAVRREVVQRPAQIALGVALDLPPMLDQPFQRGLQQVLARLLAPGEQHGRAQQGPAALGQKQLQGLGDPVTVHVAASLFPLSKYEGTRPEVD